MCVYSKSAPKKKTTPKHQQQHCSVMLAYADLTLAEYTVPTGTLTPFGKKVTPLLTQLKSLLPITHLSWDSDGQTLACSDCSKTIFVNKGRLLDFNWSCLSMEKQDGYTQLCSMKQDLEENTKEKHYRKKEVLIERKESAMKEELEKKINQAWRSLTVVVESTDNVLIETNITACDSLVAVQVPCDAILEGLPGPLKKFRHHTIL